MKPIDLLTFAEYSEKIPETSLTPQSKKEVSSWRILGSHFLDFGCSFMASTLMSVMFNHFMKLILTTKGLKLLYSEPLIVGLAGPILPLTMMTYFFCCYFFNDGQTYGMHTFKVRVDVKPQSFTQAFAWSIYSTVLCFSCGLSYFFKPSIWKHVKTHDHLYESLFQTEDKFQFDLVSKTQNVDVQESWSRAA